MKSSENERKKRKQPDKQTNTTGRAGPLSVDCYLKIIFARQKLQELVQFGPAAI